MPRAKTQPKGAIKLLNQAKGRKSKVKKLMKAGQKAATAPKKGPNLRGPKIGGNGRNPVSTGGRIKAAAGKKRRVGVKVKKW